jgi:hypothetical protein
VDEVRAARRVVAAYLLVARTMMRGGTIEDLVRDVARARGRAVELLAADASPTVLPGGVVRGDDRDYLLYPRSAEGRDVLPAVSHALAHLMLGHPLSDPSSAPATRRLAAHPFAGSAERDAIRLAWAIGRLDREEVVTCVVS